jgi:hypothetical protein
MPLYVSNLNKLSNEYNYVILLKNIIFGLEIIITPFILINNNYVITL